MVIATDHATNRDVVISEIDSRSTSRSTCRMTACGRTATPTHLTVRPCLRCRVHDDMTGEADNGKDLHSGGEHPC